MEEQQLGRGFFVKDFHFYKGTENTWNRPSWSCKKTYRFYHELDILKRKELKEKVDAVIALEKSNEHQQAQDRIHKHRNETLTRFLERKVERMVIQNKANQELETNPNQTAIEKIEHLAPETVSKHVLNKSAFRTFFRNGAPNMWNDLNKLSEKSVKLLMPKTMIKSDENATTVIASKILAERLAQEAAANQSKLLKEEIYLYEKSLKGKNDSKHSTLGSTFRSKAGTANGSVFPHPKKFETTGSSMGMIAKSQSSKDFRPRKTVADSIQGDARSDATFLQPQGHEGPVAPNLLPNQASTGFGYPIINAQSYRETLQSRQDSQFGETGNSKDLMMMTGSSHPANLTHSMNFCRSAVEKGIVNPKEFSEFRGLYVPMLTKETASIKNPYTQYMMQNSALAREKVMNELESNPSASQKHYRIRENKRVKPHLPEISSRQTKNDAQDQKKVVSS